MIRTQLSTSLLRMSAALLLAITGDPLAGFSHAARAQADTTVPTMTRPDPGRTLETHTQRAHESGLPMIRNFSVRDYGAHVQNWNVVQHDDGRIYVANREGVVLEFDGARWQLIPVDSQTTVRALSKDPSGRIYVGAQSEIGYLESDAAGRMHYRSLMPRVPESMRDFADVWSSSVTADGVYFSSASRLLRWDGETFRSWQPLSSFHLSFEIGDRLFVRDWEHGLLELIDETLQPVPGGSEHAHLRVQAMLPWREHGAILVATRGHGFFVLDDSGFRPWPTRIDAELKRDMVYRAIRLPDGRLAVGTLLGGLYLLDADGNWLSRLDRDKGLQDNSVYFLLLDRQDALWLALDRGIARVEISNPVTQFNEEHGLAGAILDLHRHDDRLFAATAQGLFRLEPGPAARWQRIDDILAQTWHLLTVDDTLLVANSAGVYRVDEERAELLRRFEFHSLSLHASRHQPDRVHIGLLDGFAAIRRSGSQWLDDGRVPGIDDEIRAIAEDADGRLWLTTGHTGLLRITPGENGSLDHPERIERFGIEHGLPSLQQNHVYVLDEQIVFATHDGLRRFDEAQGRFIPDLRLAGLFPDDQPRIWPIAKGRGDWIWLRARNDSGLVQTTLAAVRGADGDYVEVATLPPPLNEMIHYAILADADGIVWFGGAEGLFRFDPNIERNYELPFPTLLRDVRDQDGRSLLHGDTEAVGSQLHASRNRLRFEYAAPSYDGLEDNRFQVILEGQDHDWSPWTAETFIDYANLREGDYRFRVRARNLYGAIGDEVSMAFVVRPPWYRTLWAYLAYLLLLGGSAWAGLRWYLRRVEAQKRALEVLVAERTEQLTERTRQLEEAMLTDQLTGLRNRRFLENRLDADIHALLREYKSWAANKPSRTPPTVGHLFFMIDLDHFKQVNDVHGHAAGDRVLEQIAQLLGQIFRESDIIVRWGGEEFLAIARFVRRDSAASLAERIRTVVEEHDFDIGAGHRLKLTCSIGIACFPFAHDNPDALSWTKIVDIADHCLYAAKLTQRNAWVGACAQSERLSRDQLVRLPREPQRLADSPGVKLVSSIRSCHTLVWQ